MTEAEKTHIEAQVAVSPEAVDEVLAETFEPFEKWKAAWKPHAEYITLAQVQELVGDKDLAEVLSRCQCIGYTMHVEKEIPSGAWTDPGWQWDVDENRCGQSQYGEHLQFQVEVFEADVVHVLEGPVPAGPPTVEVLEGFKGLPEGWKMSTLEGLAWQTFSEDGVYSPLRADVAQAVGDAWSYKTTGKWA